MTLETAQTRYPDVRLSLPGRPKMDVADLTCIGGGVASYQVLMAIIREKRRDHILGPMQVLESSDDPARLAQGLLTSYHIPSHTSYESFTSHAPDGLLKPEVDSESSFDLPDAAPYLRAVRDFVSQHVTEHLGQKVIRVVRSNSGLFNVQTADNDYRTRKVLLAPGGIEKKLFVRGENAKKVIRSSELFTNQAINEGKIDLNEDKRFLVVGGSHSALSVIFYLLRLADEQGVDGLEIDLYSKYPIKVACTDVNEAKALGLRFTQEDICRQTGMVFRFAGIRGASKQKYIDIVTGRESRVRIHEETAPSNTDYQAADKIISSIGYRARKIPIVDERGKELGPVRSGSKVLTSSRGRVYMNSGKKIEVIPNVWAYGIGHGLATGDFPGGEKSFIGAVEGVQAASYIGKVMARNL